MNSATRWLNWKPDQPQITESSHKTKPAKPPKPSFAGFDGSVSRDKQIIDRGPSVLTKNTPTTTYPLPKGVTLVRFTPKTAPVAITVCSVVNDVPKFIQHALV